MAHKITALTNHNWHRSAKNMRLALAASVLATALPTGLSLRKSTDTSPTTSFEFDNDQKNDIQKQFFYDEKGRFKDFAMQHSLFGIPWSSTAVLKNARLDNDIIECDPEADIGVLACGTNEYCMEVPESSFGGVCVSSVTTTGGTERRIFELHGHGDFFCGEVPNRFCDCSSWNSSTYTGIIQCGRRVGCYESCEDTYYCLDFLTTYVNDGTTAVRSDFRSFTGTFVSNISDVGGWDINGDYFCEIVINGTACSYCNFLNSTCRSFDCSNAGHDFYDCETGAGNVVLFTFPPPTCNYTTECSICAEGEFLVEGDIYVDLNAGPRSCAFLYNFTESKEDLLSIDPLCGYTVAYARGPCCE